MGLFNKPQQTVQVVHKYEDSNKGGCCGCLVTLGIIIFVALIIILII